MLRMLKLISQILSLNRSSACLLAAAAVTLFHNGYNNFVVGIPLEKLFGYIQQMVYLCRNGFWYR